MARRRSHIPIKHTAASSKITVSWPVVLAVALFLLTRGCIFFVLDPRASDVTATYFVQVALAYDSHLTPYQGECQIAYPPLAWWVIYAPRFFDSQHLTPPDVAQLNAVRANYTRGFRGEMFVCDVVSFLMLLLILKKRQPRLTGWALLTYTIITAIFGHMLYDRLDVGLLLLLLAWAFCWIKSLEVETGTIAWSTAAYAFLGLGISFKLIPVIIVPVSVLADWKSSRRGLRLATGLAASAVTAVLPFAIQYGISGWAVLDPFVVHRDRGIQVESLYSTIMMIGSLLDWDAFIMYKDGAYHIFGDLSKLMIGLSNVLLLGFLAGTSLWFYLRPTTQCRQQAYRIACFVVFGAVIVSKVLSPQYFIWSLPMSLLLAVELFPLSSAKVWTLAGLWVIVAVLSTWLFPYHYFSKPGLPGLVSSNPLEAKVLNTVPCIVLGARNLIYLGMVIWLGVLLFLRTDPGSANKA